MKSKPQNPKSKGAPTREPTALAKKSKTERRELTPEELERIAGGKPPTSTTYAY